ncbi:MAG: hypothetical protein JW751_00495 [Polyangiaceae bacterium]|nr:hypothetical protein [Polyangiaceae bacterium]
MKRNIEARDLGPEQIFSASLIAGLNSFGILNQAVVCSATRQIGKDLAEYYFACNPLAEVMPNARGMSTIDACRKAIDVLQSLLRISEEIECGEDGNSVVVRVRASRCRYCPKGVGRAELKGTLCPFPTLIETFVNTLSNRTVITVFKEDSMPLLKKDGDWCMIRYTPSG